MGAKIPQVFVLKRYNADKFPHSKGQAKS